MQESFPGIFTPYSTYYITVDIRIIIAITTIILSLKQVTAL